MFLKSCINGVLIHVTPNVIAKELHSPLTVGPSTVKIIISDTLLERAAHDLWISDSQTIGAGVNLGSLTKDAWVLSTFLHYWIIPSAHTATLHALSV